MEAGNLTIHTNMTEETSPSSSSSRYARIELIGGIVCMVVGITLAVISVVFITCTWKKRRRLRLEEEKASKHSIDLKEYRGRGNPSFEMDEDDHVGLPLPSRSPRIFSLSNYEVGCHVSAQLYQQQQLEQQQQQLQQRQQQQQKTTTTTTTGTSKRQDSNSSSDSEVGAVCLHRTSPLAAIYLIYDELNNSSNRSPRSPPSTCVVGPAKHS